MEKRLIYSSWRFFPSVIESTFIFNIKKNPQKLSIESLQGQTIVRARLN